MTCDICKEEIKTPYYVEITAVVVKHDKDYVAGLTFTPEEKENLVTTLHVHKDCWKSIANVKKDSLKTLSVSALPEKVIIKEVI